MISNYIQASMKIAQYELIEDDTWFGTIPDFEGLWANAPTKDSCVIELQSVLEDWILISLNRGMPVPTVDGLNLNLDPAPMEVA